MSVRKLEWYVFCEDLSTSKIEIINAFTNWTFKDYVEKLLDEDFATKEEFSEALKREVSYYFRGKREWECRILPLYSDNHDVKVDVHWQLMMNWDKFCDYVWSSRNNK